MADTSSNTVVSTESSTHSGSGIEAAGLKIESLVLERFRGFRKLRINGFGRVNLITGKNSTGKTSILEGIRILAHQANPGVIDQILRYREEAGFEDQSSYSFTHNLSLVSTLFNGFPFQNLDSIPVIKPIILQVTGSLKPAMVKIGIGWDTREYGENNPPSIETNSSRGSDSNSDVFPGLIVGLDSRAKLYDLRNISLFRDLFDVMIRRHLHEKNNLGLPGVIRCVSVDAYASKMTSNLADLWDAIILSGSEQHIVKALNIIEPRINAISMIGDDRGLARRRAVVRTSDLKRAVSLRSLGDGLNRLFYIILSLFNARESILVIDEFENGLHYSVQSDLWKVIFDLALKLKVQVFATSHSWDTIKTFQQAAEANSNASGVLIRLTRTAEDIVPTVFDCGELSIVTRNQIEVR